MTKTRKLTLSFETLRNLDLQAVTAGEAVPTLTPECIATGLKPERVQ
jgi:hypothetical protein